MRVVVNGEGRELAEGSTVSDLVRELGLEGRPCAAEVNGAVVRRTEHGERVLADGDVVELVTLVGGG